MLTKREITLGSLIAVFVFLAGYLVGQNVARQPDQTAEVLDLKLQNSELQRKIAVPSAPQDQTAALQANAEAETAAAQQLQSKLNEANQRAQTEADTVIDLQHQLDAAQRTAQVRVDATQRVMMAACQSRILNAEAQLKLLPASGPAVVAIKILESALQQNGDQQ